MSLWLSLFGGMILTALFYGAGRRFRLSNFWASVLGCGMPLAMYLVLAIVTAPGLDVVTLHLVAYPTVSVLLFLLYGDMACRGDAMHWAPKLLIGFFVLLSAVFGVFVYIAGQGLPVGLAQWLLPDAKDKRLHTGFAGVVAHKQADSAKSISSHLLNEHLLRQLGWRVEFEGLGRLAANAESDVTIRILDRDGRGVDDARAELSIVRPGELPAGATVLTHIGDGLYQARMKPAGPGTWIVHATLHGQGEAVRLEHALDVR